MTYKKYIVQGYSLYGWTNLKSFALLKSAEKSCGAILKKGRYKTTRVVVDNGDKYVRVYPKPVDKEGNVIDESRR